MEALFLYGGIHQYSDQYYSTYHVRYAGVRAMRGGVAQISYSQGPVYATV